jgi:hypothetical protein
VTVVIFCIAAYKFLISERGAISRTASPNLQNASPTPRLPTSRNPSSLSGIGMAKQITPTSGKSQSVRLWYKSRWIAIHHAKPTA